MNKKNIIMALAISTLTGCTCTDAFQKSTCNNLKTAVLNGMISGMDKHNQRMSEYREAEAIERFEKRMGKTKYYPNNSR